jgi:thiol:disulfide interchange protein DsbC
MNVLKRALLVVLTALLCGAAGAQQPGPAGAAEALVRKNLTERIPRLGTIDEVNRTPMPGLFEVRVGTELYYSDAEGSFLLMGQLIDARNRKNLTEARLEKILAIPFDSLPLKDAFRIVRGNGKRKLAVFEDPNCGYCKQFERGLQTIDNVTIYMFLYPILGPDSSVKSRNIWCAKDKAQAWQDWMVRDLPPAGANCDASALLRNQEFGRKNRISGTPTLFFADGSRAPGALPADQVEKMLAEAK